jgi:hypothetical protein
MAKSRDLFAAQGIPLARNAGERMHATIAEIAAAENL